MAISRLVVIEIERDKNQRVRLDSGDAVVSNSRRWMCPEACENWIPCLVLEKMSKIAISRLVVIEIQRDKDERVRLDGGDAVVSISRR